MPQNTDLLDLEQILNQAGYKIQLCTSNDEETGHRGFSVAFPNRTLLDSPPTPLLITYVCHEDSVDVMLAYDDEDCENEEYSYDIPDYAHRVLLEADLIQYCSENAFHKELIDYDNEYRGFMDEEQREKEVALLATLDDYKYKNTWRARRAAKKLDVLDGFVALHSYFKERGSDI